MILREPPIAPNYLIQKHRPIKRIPLHRLEPRIADNPPQLFLGRAVEVPAAFTTFSSSITEPTSFPPNRSPICSTFSPCVTQLACTFSMLSRYIREIASVFRYSTEVASSHPRPPRAVLCG